MLANDSEPNLLKDPIHQIVLCSSSGSYLDGVPRPHSPHPDRSYPMAEVLTLTTNSTLTEPGRQEDKAGVDWEGGGTSLQLTLPFSNRSVLFLQL